VGQHRADEVGRDYKIGVEQRGELGRRVIQTVRECATLESLAVGAMDVRDVEALRAVACDERACELYRVIGRIIEQLNRQELLRIVELGRRSEEAGEHVALVVDGQLDDDAGKLISRQRRRVIEPSRAAATIERDEDVAIQADQRQQKKGDTVNDEGSARKHLLDGGRMTERDWCRGRRDSHDGRPYCTWRAQKMDNPALAHDPCGKSLDPVAV